MNEPEVRIVTIDKCTQDELFRLLHYCWFRGMENQEEDEGTKGQGEHQHQGQEEGQDEGLLCLLTCLIVGLGYRQEEAMSLVDQLWGACTLLSEHMVTAARAGVHAGQELVDVLIALLRELVSGQLVLQRVRPVAPEDQGYIDSLMSFLREHPTSNPRPAQYLPFHGFYLAFDQQTGGLLGCMSCAPHDNPDLQVKKPTAVAGAQLLSAIGNHVIDNPQVAGLLHAHIDEQLRAYAGGPEVGTALFVVSKSEYDSASTINAAEEAATAAGFVPIGTVTEPDGTEFLAHEK